MSFIRISLLSKNVSVFVCFIFEFFNFVHEKVAFLHCYFSHTLAKSAFKTILEGAVFLQTLPSSLNNDISRKVKKEKMLEEEENRKMLCFFRSRESPKEDGEERLHV